MKYITMFVVVIGLIFAFWKDQKTYQPVETMDSNPVPDLERLAFALETLRSEQRSYLQKPKKERMSWVEQFHQRKIEELQARLLLEARK